tara:strand:+ start:531 stop:881 length:351 start_codon:yes stop_codon:yes gene_type:complete
MIDTTNTDINGELDKLLRGSRSFKELHPKAIDPTLLERRYFSYASIRVSKKQLWFFAYRSKELTGTPFECEGGVDYPTRFLVGQWPDGSPVWAEVTKNNVDGPFWVRYSIAMLELA